MTGRPRIVVRDAVSLARGLDYKGPEGAALRASLLDLVEGAYALHEAHAAECGCTEPASPTCTWPRDDARLLACFDFGDGPDDDPGSIPGLPAWPLGPQPRMDTRVAAMGGTGLEPVGPDSDVGDGSGTEGPGKATGAGDSDDPERPLADTGDPDRTPGIGAPGSKAGLVGDGDRGPGVHRIGGVDYLVGRAGLVGYPSPAPLVRCPTGLACTGCRYCEALWEAVGR